MQGNGLKLNRFYRVWPDGTVQCAEDGPPHPWMSGVYHVVEALDEASAFEQASGEGWL